eukprot:6792596-Ditylum_brightwellii.AAC.2
MVQSGSELLLDQWRCPCVCVSARVAWCCALLMVHSRGLVPVRVPLLLIAPIWHPSRFSRFDQAVPALKYVRMGPRYWMTVWRWVSVVSSAVDWGVELAVGWGLVVVG